MEFLPVFLNIKKQTCIVIGGGEVLSTPFRNEPTVEVYTAGAEAWRLGPDLPIAVHGVTGAAISSAGAGSVGAGTPPASLRSVYPRERQIFSAGVPGSTFTFSCG